MGAIAALRRSLDGGEILVVVVAIPEKEEVLQACPLLEAEGMPAKEFARHAHEADLTIKKRCLQVWPTAFRVLPIIEIDDSLAKCIDVTCLDGWICQIDAALELEIILVDLEFMLISCLAANGFRQVERLAS